MMKNEVMGYQLFESRRNGKIHLQWCGARSLYIAPIKGSENMTYREAVEKFGDNLCGICFKGFKQA